MNVFIAGATSDISIKLIKLLLTEGHNIYLLGGSNAYVLNDIKDRVAYIKLGDLTNKAKVDEIFEELKEVDIDIFINLMGKAYFELFQFIEEEKWEEIIDINLNSSYYLLKKIVPIMIRKKYGKIILVSSIWGKVGSSMEVAYSTAKGGLNIMAKSLGKELAPSNISVNSLNLGMIDTKMNDNLTEDDKKTIEQEIPYGRMATTEETAIFIKKIMEMPQYFTAQNINFDGGWF